MDVYVKRPLRRGVGKVLADWIGGVTTNPTLILGLMALVLLIGGMFLDPITVFVIFVPMMVPTAAAVGINLNIMISFGTTG